jgi:Domain of unknown function (DUF397)
MSDMVRGKAAGDDTDESDREWRKSSRSYGSGQCVQVAAHSGKHIYVRDSKNAHGAILTFSSIEWNSFVAIVQNGGLGL